MDDTSTHNPRETASFISRLTFSWINQVLTLGSQHPLEEKDLFPLETSFQAEKLTNDLEREWLAEERASQQSRKPPRLWRAMTRLVSYRDYITIGILRILYSFSFNVMPLLLWFFLRSISSASDSGNYTSTVPFIICISVASTARSVFIGQGEFRAEMIAVKLKVALIGLVYKKVNHIQSTIRSKGSIRDNRRSLETSALLWGAEMAQWLSICLPRRPPTNVARVRFPDSASYVG